MISFVYRPLIWTGPRTPAHQRRSRYTFKAGWSTTLNKLSYEIDQLRGTEVVFEADFREQDLRQDGMPRANARQPEFPGVKISFNTPNLGRLEYATDAYEFWQHNVRAIALSLEALRAVDRYGTTSGRQQYTGFKAIGGDTAMPGRSRMTRDEAAQFIAEHQPSGDPALVKSLILSADERLSLWYRFAARRLHPDVGGSTELFQRLQEAKAVLDA